MTKVDVVEGMLKQYVETVQNRDVGMPRAGGEYDPEVTEAGG